MNAILSEYVELAAYLRLVQRQYAEALAAGDTAGMAETSNDLGLAYAALGNTALAGRWAAEFLRLTLDA